jgi:hypothetical protein
MTSAALGTHQRLYTRLFQPLLKILELVDLACLSTVACVLEILDLLWQLHGNPIGSQQLPR